MTQNDRLDNLRRLVKDGEPNVWKKLITRHVLDDADADSEYFDDRYLVLLRTDYDMQEDETDIKTDDSLEDVRVMLDEHIFQEAGTDYSFHAQVIDLDEGRLVEWDAVQEILIQGNNKSVFVVHNEGYENGSRPCVGVYASPAKAEAAIEEFVAAHDGRFDKNDYSIEELPLQ